MTPRCAVVKAWVPGSAYRSGLRKHTRIGRSSLQGSADEGGAALSKNKLFVAEVTQSRF
jgi:hypothetical protein